jgi:hypothetical protein
MSPKHPKKRYFKPPKPVNKMTEEELDEFANNVFKALLGDIEEAKAHDDEPR